MRVAFPFIARLAGLCAIVLPCCAAGPSAQVDRIFQRYASPASPGCAVGVIHNGRTAISKGYGLANLDYGLPLTPKSRFYMASVSKQFTSLAALLAAREGRLSLDDRLHKHVPEMPAYAQSIPLRRMLDHTAGLRDYLTLWALKGWSNESVLREAPTLSLIARQQALDFEPGADHSYSNSGYFLMALILERTTGQRLDAFLQDRLFRPLGMKSTHFQHDHSMPIPDRAQGYTRRDNNWRTAGVGFDLAGSGGLYSTIEDMLLWARNFDQPKAAAAVLDALQTPGKLNDGRETPRGYALGLLRDRTGGTLRLSHGGSATGYKTFFARFPEKKLAIVTLCNAGDADAEALSMQVAAVFAPDLKVEPRKPANKPPAAQPPPPDRRRLLTGVYWSEELESVWRIVEREGRLFVQSDGAEVEMLRDDKGVLTAGAATIERDRDGLTVSAGRARNIRFVGRYTR